MTPEIIINVVGILDELEQSKERRDAAQRARDAEAREKSKKSYEEEQERHRQEQSMREQAEAFYNESDLPNLLGRLRTAAQYTGEIGTIGMQDYISWVSEFSDKRTTYSAPVKTQDRLSKIVVFEWELPNNPKINTGIGYKHIRMRGFLVEVTPTGELRISGSSSSRYSPNQWRDDSQLQQEAIERAFKNPFDVRIKTEHISQDRGDSSYFGR